MPRLDYARLTDAPRTVTLGGQDYLVPRLRPAILGELDAWLRSVVPNPLREARACLKESPHLSEEVQKAIWLASVEAARHWPPRYDSPEGEEWIFETFEGITQLLYALLRRTNPGFTLDDAAELADTVDDPAEIDALLEAIGPGELGDPKAEEAPGEETRSRPTNASGPSSPSPTDGPSPPSTR